MALTDYEVRVVERSGEPVAILDNAVPTRLVWQLNRPGLIVFRNPISDPKLRRSIAVLDHTEPGDQGPEVQVWRRGRDGVSRCIHWGVFLKDHATTRGGEVTFQCPGLLWYFTRRHVGADGRALLLHNHSFEDPIVEAGPTAFGNWDRVGGFAWERVTSHRFHGARGLRLDNANADEQAYVYQWTDPLPAGPYRLKARVHVVAGTDFAGAYKDRGLWVGRYSSDFGFSGQAKATRLAKRFGHRAGRSYSPSIRLHNPDPDTRYQVRCYSPRGGVVWDAVEMWGPSLLAGTDPGDVAAIMALLVEHAQDPAAGKSGLNIVTDCPATGENEHRAYYAHERLNIATALDDFLDHVDFDVTWDRDNPGVRTFRTYYPQRGQYRPELALVGGKNVTEAEQETTGEDVASVAHARNSEQPWNRQVESARDTTYTGGLVLEQVFDVPRGIRGKRLDRHADAQLRRHRKPLKVPTLTVGQDPTEPYDPTVALPADVIDLLEPGDSFPVDVEDGWITEQRDMRAVEMELVPGDEEFHVTVNEP